MKTTLEAITSTSEARIYVGTYHKYNCGSIAGKWLDLGDYSDKDEFYEACEELHSDEEDPEYMFQDWEGIPAEMIGESWLSDSVFEWLELDEDEREIIKLYSDCTGYDLNNFDDLKERAEDAYAGRFDSFLDYAYEYIDSTGMLQDVPESIKNYFDYDSFARDLEMDYMTTEAENGDIVIFHNY